MKHKMFIYQRAWVGVLLLATVLISSCSHDYVLYDTNRKSGVYIVGSDTTPITFHTMSVGDSTVLNINALLVGMPVDYDREISFSVDEENTTAIANVHYSLPKKLILKAGTVRCDLPLVFYRYRDKEFIGKKYQIKINFQSNEQLDVLHGITPNGGQMIQTTVVTIFREVEPSQPFWWYNNVSVLGKWDPRKMVDMNAYYLASKETDPLAYNTLHAKWGEYVHDDYDFSGGYIQSVLYAARRAVFKPMYDYYVAHPELGLSMPDPTPFL